MVKHGLFFFKKGVLYMKMLSIILQLIWLLTIVLYNFDKISFKSYTKITLASFITLNIVWLFC